jgi:prophage tail gpP-like protein
MTTVQGSGIAAITGQPENGTVLLQIPSAGINITTFKTYEFNSNFLAPTDGWHFTIGDDELTDSIIKTLLPGTLISFSINGLVQGTGYVDGVDVASSGKGGTEITVHGRDRLAQVVDACADPRIRLTSGMSINDALRTFLSSFGWSNPDTQYLVNNEPNRNVMTGQTRGTPTSKKGKPLKSYTIHQTKPYPAEGTFAFLSRLSQRFGLWIWLTADGQFVVISKPDFTSPSIYTLRHKRGPESVYNNIESSHASVDYSNQPSVIIATGFGTGGENAIGGLSVGIVNPAIDTNNSAIINAYPSTRFVPWPDTPWISPPVAFPYARPLFLHDDESKTIDELTAFVRREMSLRVRKTLTYTCEVEGHAISQTTGKPNEGDAYVWTVDTMVNVEDDISNIHEPLYLMARTFIKSRDGGTRTRLELIRPHSIEF